MLFNFELETIPFYIYIIELLLYTYVCIKAITYVYRNKVYKDSSKFRAIAFLCFFIIVSNVYCVNHDYFEYRRFCEDLNHILIYYDKEMVYATLAEFVGCNYEMFRLIIWGGGLLLFFLSLKFANSKEYIGLLLLFSLYVNIYCYARASLAMGFFLFGLVILVKSKNSWLFKLIGIVLILSSVIFHRSMVFAILCLSFLYIDFSNIKKTFLISSFIIGISVILVPLLDFSFQGNDYTNIIEGYKYNIEHGMWESRSFVNFVQKAWSYSLFYIPFFIITKVVAKYKKLINVQIYRIFKVTAGIITIATVLMFVYGYGNPFFYRVLFMTMLPISLLLAYCYCNKLIRWKSIMYVILWSWLYHVIYMYVNMENLGFL